MNAGYDAHERPHRMPDCTGIRERTRFVNNCHEGAGIAPARQRNATQSGTQPS